MSSDEIAVGPYSDDADDEDDVVTLQMDAPLDDGEWMLQTSAYDRRRLSTAQLSAERASGALPASTRVWRNGMRAWTPLGEVDFAAEQSAALPQAGAAKPGPEEVATIGTRPLVPPLAASPKRPVPLPSPPPPRIAPPPSRPFASAAPLGSSALGSSPMGSPGLGPISAGARALGSSPSSAFGFGAPRAPGLSPPPPRVEVPASLALPAFDTPPLSVPLSSTAPAQRIDTATSVALDLSAPVAPQRSRARAGLVAQGAAVVVALLGTSYALTRAGVFEPGAPGAARGAVASQEAPASARLALQPVVAAPSVAAPSSAATEAAPSSEPSLAAGSSVASEPVAPGAAAPAGAVEPGGAAPAASEGASGSAVEAPAATRQASEQASEPSEHEQKPAADGASELPGHARAPSDADSADPGSRRAKRAARRAAALEARRQKRATRAVTETPARAEPERAEAAAPAQEPGSTFDRQAAQAALSAAAEQAKNCRPIGGPSGSGTVQVQYEPSGKVGTVTIVTPGFENSDAAACIQMLFRRARVPAFNGAKGAVVRQRFEIP